MAVSLDRARLAATKLLSYCRENDWSGFDPYDALNSRLAPFMVGKWGRLGFTQVLKRSPVNVRRLLLVPKTENAKAIALFLSALLKLSRAAVGGADDLAWQMLERLIKLRSRNVPRWCWGYSFPWQTRGIIVPRNAPNLVCTTFVANSLLDLYEERHERECLGMAIGAAEYLLEELYWTNGGSSAGFSYPQPQLRGHVHNADLLGAALLSRVHRVTGDTRFKTPALQVARYSAAAQRADGAWPYGEGARQQWIDNFHTGYNLCALRTIGRSLETCEFEPSVERGLTFYRASFFREDGAARYFHDRTYPIDIHSVAQSIITLVTLRDRDPASMPLARSVLSWALEHMWDERGFFYYRVLRFGTIRTPYMRWSQAWMLLALSTLLSSSDRVVGGPHASPARSVLRD